MKALGSSILITRVTDEGYSRNAQNKISTPQRIVRHYKHIVVSYTAHLVKGHVNFCRRVSSVIFPFPNL